MVERAAAVTRRSQSALRNATAGGKTDKSAKQVAALSIHTRTALTHRRHRRRSFTPLTALLWSVCVCAVLCGVRAGRGTVGGWYRTSETTDILTARESWRW